MDQQNSRSRSLQRMRRLFATLFFRPGDLILLLITIWLVSCLFLPAIVAYRLELDWQGSQIDWWLFPAGFVLSGMVWLIGYATCYKGRLVPRLIIAAVIGLTAAAFLLMSARLNAVLDDGAMYLAGFAMLTFLFWVAVIAFRLFVDVRLWMPGLDSALVKRKAKSRIRWLIMICLLLFAAFISSKVAEGFEILQFHILPGLVAVAALFTLATWIVPALIMVLPLRPFLKWLLLVLQLGGLILIMIPLSFFTTDLRNGLSPESFGIIAASAVVFLLAGWIAAHVNGVRCVLIKRKLVAAKWAHHPLDDEPPTQTAVMPARPASVAATTGADIQQPFTKFRVSLLGTLVPIILVGTGFYFTRNYDFVAFMKSTPQTRWVNARAARTIFRLALRNGADLKADPSEYFEIFPYSNWPPPNYTKSGEHIQIDVPLVKGSHQAIRRLDNVAFTTVSFGSRDAKGQIDDATWNAMTHFASLPPPPAQRWGPGGNPRSISITNANLRVKSAASGTQPITLFLTKTTNTDAFLQAISKHNCLSELSLYETDVTNDGLKSIEAMTNLTSLSIHAEGEELPNPSIDLAKLKNLGELWIGGSAFDDRFAKAHLPTARAARLDLTDTKISAKTLMESVSPRTVSVITFNQSDWTYGDGIGLKGKLNGAKVTGWPRIDPSMDAISEIMTNDNVELAEVLELLELKFEKNDAGQIVSLDLEKLDIGDKSMKLVAELDHLQSLKLQSNGPAWQYSQKLNQNSSFGVSFSIISPQSIVAMQKLKELQILLLPGEIVDDAGFVELTKITNLVETQFDPHIVPASRYPLLQNLTRLERLHLLSEQVDAALIAELQQLPALKTITLHEGLNDGTFTITYDEALQALKSNLPQIEIVPTKSNAALTPAEPKP